MTFRDIRIETLATSVALRTDATIEEQNILTEYASSVKTGGVIVEVGTGEGGTAIELYNSSTSSVCTIDPYSPSDTELNLDINGISYIRKSSEEAAKLWSGMPIDLLFIDGRHDFESLTIDILSWTPKLASDGIVIFDDYEPVERGGIANLAVKLCLDALLETAMLTKVEHRHKMLVATVNRGLVPSDVDIVYQHLKQLSSEDDTHRARCEMLAAQLPQHFWYHYSYAVDRIAFRGYIETYNMLQLTRPVETRIDSTASCSDKIDWLSGAIAFKQVELNILRQALNALLFGNVYNG